MVSRGFRCVTAVVPILFVCISCVFGPDVELAANVDEPPHIEEVQPDAVIVTFNLSALNPSRNFSANRILDFDLPDGQELRARFIVQIADNPPIEEPFEPLSLQPVQDDDTRLLYSSANYEFQPCEIPDVVGGAQNGTLRIEVVDPIPGELQREPEKTAWTSVYIWYLRFEGSCDDTTQ